MRISKWVLDDEDEIEFKDAEAVNQTDGELNDTIVTYEGNTSDVQSWTDFIASFVNGMKIGKFFKNLYAGIQYVLHVGSLVNNCVTDNSDLPLSAAQGKVLMDELTQVKSDLSELWTTQNFSQSVTMGPLSYADYTFDATLDGYTPVGIIGTWVNNWTYIFLLIARLQGNTVTLRPRNTNADSSGTATIGCTVLYIKAI